MSDPEFHDPNEDPPFNPEETGPENASDAWAGYTPPPPIAPGEVHEPIVQAVEFLRSKRGGHPQVLLVLHDPEKDPNAVVQGKVYLTRKPGFATTMWKRGFEALGLTDPFDGGDGKMPSKDDFVGKLVKATTKAEDYNGEEQIKYDNLEPPTAGAGAKAYGF